jgi:hypothetical protein
MGLGPTTENSERKRLSFEKKRPKEARQRDHIQSLVAVAVNGLRI